MTSAKKKIYLEPSWELEASTVENAPTPKNLPESRNLEAAEDSEVEQIGAALDTPPPAKSHIEKTSTKPKTRVLGLLPAESTELNFQLKKLVEMASTCSEAYTALLFLTDEAGALKVFASQSLSSEIAPEAADASLIKWTAESKARISISKIDHEQHVPGYYFTGAEEVNSFCAVPIVGVTGRLEGVISIDSKKSYAFGKQSEHLLESLAHQAAFLIYLHKDKAKSSDPADYYEERFDSACSVESLLRIASDLPQSVIPHQSSVLVAQAELIGKPDAKLYGYEEDSAESNRLLEIVCKRKRGLSPSHTVKVLPTADVTNSPFVSVPIKVLGEEAGSINILGGSGADIESSDVVRLERYAKSVSQRLENIKLRELSSKVKASTNLLGTWKQFEAEAAERIYLQEEPLVLSKLELGELSNLELECGVDVATLIEDRFVSLASQLARSNYLLTRGTGSSLYVLCPTSEANSYKLRLQALMKRVLPGTEFSANKQVTRASEIASKSLQISSKQITALSDIRAIIPSKEELKEVVNG